MIGKTYDLGPCQAFVIFPGVESVYQADVEDPWTYCWVGMHGYNVEEFFSGLKITPENPIIDLSSTRELEGSVEEMLEMSQMPHSNELIRLGQTIRFLGFLEKYKKGGPLSGNDRRYTSRDYVDYAMDFIRNNYRGNVRIGEVAEQIGINRSYLSRNFKREIGMTPQEYLIDYRLERAAELLNLSDESIGMISAMVGYADQMAFSKSFKKKYGITPWQYRKKRNGSPRKRKSKYEGDVEIKL